MVLKFRYFDLKKIKKEDRPCPFLKSFPGRVCGDKKMLVENHGPSQYVKT